MLPKYNLLYYKALLDKCFARFFDEYNDKFIKNDKQQYVLADNVSKAKLKQTFKQYLKEELLLYVSSYSIVKPNYYLIIGACQPKDNLLLQLRDDSYFPHKLLEVVNRDCQVKYLLKEKDIQLDLLKFNQMCLEIFQELFIEHANVIKLLGKEYCNVFFVQHKQLDCYLLFKTIKSIYGRSNCWNIHREKFADVKSPLIAVNELIDRYVHNKNKLNSLDEFKKITAEVKQFIDNIVQYSILNGK